MVNLTEKNINEIITILNDFPIREIPRVNALRNVINSAIETSQEKVESESIEETPVKKSVKIKEKV
jgi:hypothetical protein